MKEILEQLHEQSLLMAQIINKQFQYLEFMFEVRLNAHLRDIHKMSTLGNPSPEETMKRQMGFAEEIHVLKEKFEKGNAELAAMLQNIKEE